MDAALLPTMKPLEPEQRVYLLARLDIASIYGKYQGWHLAADWVLEQAKAIFAQDNDEEALALKRLAKRLRDAGDQWSQDQEPYREAQVQVIRRLDPDRTT